MSTLFVRRLRLGAAFVLLTYVCLHFVNHALGLVSLDAMASGRWWFLALWRSALGTLALYGAITVHGVLALWLLYDRRSLRMPRWEAVQYAVGLALPALLVVHVVSTRIAWWRFGADDPYPRIVLALWMLSPEFGARQALTLVLARLDPDHLPQRPRRDRARGIHDSRREPPGRHPARVRLRRPRALLDLSGSDPERARASGAAERGRATRARARRRRAGREARLPDSPDS